MTSKQLVIIIAAATSVCGVSAAIATAAACRAKKEELTLAVGMVSTVGVIIALHFISPWLPGTAGSVFKNNMEQNINAEALFYTEVGDVKEFLNQETGRYGIDLGISIPKAAKKP